MDRKLPLRPSLLRSLTWKRPTLLRLLRPLPCLPRLSLNLHPHRLRPRQARGVLHPPLRCRPSHFNPLTVIDSTKSRYSPLNHSTRAKERLLVIQSQSTSLRMTKTMMMYTTSWMTATAMSSSWTSLEFPPHSRRSPTRPILSSSTAMTRIPRRLRLSLLVLLNCQKRISLLLLTNPLPPSFHLPQNPLR